MRLILYTMILISPVCVIAQETSSEDTICFTTNEAKILLSSTEKYYLCDSLIRVYDTTINNLEKITALKDGQLQITQTIINGQAVKIKRTKTLSWALGSGLLISIILGILF